MRATYAEVGVAVPSLPDSAPISRLQRDPRFGSVRRGIGAFVGRPRGERPDQLRGARGGPVGPAPGAMRRCDQWSHHISGN